MSACAVPVVAEGEASMSKAFQEEQTAEGKPCYRRRAAVLGLLGAAELLLLSAGVVWKTVQRSLPQVVLEHVTFDGSAGRKTLLMTVDASHREPLGAWHGLRLLGGVCEATRDCNAGRCSVARARLRTPTAPSEGRLRSSADFLELNVEQLSRAVASGGGGLRLVCDTDVEVDVFKTGAVFGHTMRWDVPIGDGMASAKYRVERVDFASTLPKGVNAEVAANGTYILHMSLPSTSELAKLISAVGLSVRADMGYAEVHKEALKCHISINAEAGITEDQGTGEVVVSIPFKVASNARLSVLAMYGLMAHLQPLEVIEVEERPQRVSKHEVAFAPTSDAGPLKDLLGGEHTLTWHKARPAGAVSGRRLFAEEQSDCLSFDGQELGCYTLISDEAMGTASVDFKSDFVSSSVGIQSTDGVFKLRTEMSMPADGTTPASTMVGNIEMTWDDASQHIEVSFGEKANLTDFRVSTSGMDSDTRSMDMTLEVPSMEAQGAEATVNMASGWLSTLSFRLGATAADGSVKPAGTEVDISGEATDDSSWDGTWNFHMGGVKLMTGTMTYEKGAGEEVSATVLESDDKSMKLELANSGGAVDIDVTFRDMDMPIHVMLSATHVEFSILGMVVDANWAGNATHEFMKVDMGSTTMEAAATKADQVFTKNADGDVILLNPGSAGFLMQTYGPSFGADDNGTDSGDGDNGTDSDNVIQITVMEVFVSMRKVSNVFKLEGHFGSQGELYGASLSTDTSNATKLGVEMKLHMAPGSEMVVFGPLIHSRDGLWQDGILHSGDGAQQPPIMYVNASRGFVIPVIGKTGKALCVGTGDPAVPGPQRPVEFICVMNPEEGLMLFTTKTDGNVADTTTTATTSLSLRKTATSAAAGPAAACAKAVGLVAAIAAAARAA